MIILYSAMIDTPENLSKFELIYSKYKNTMFSVTCDLTKNIHTAEDIYRDVLRLRYLHHLTAKEIANILNSNEFSINTRLMRARQKLSMKVREYRNV